LLACLVLHRLIMVVSRPPLLTHRSYVANLVKRGGGLVLGTDHDAFVTGINVSILSLSSCGTFSSILKSALSWILTHRFGNSISSIVALFPPLQYVNDRISINRFSGNFRLTYIPVDQTHVLMSYPAQAAFTSSPTTLSDGRRFSYYLWDNSSPSMTPYGLQPSGQFLYSLAFHSSNT